MNGAPSPHAAEFRRCLIEADVSGIMKVWAHTAPHLATASPADALLSLHIARCEAKYMPKKLKEWSTAFLADQGIQKLDGRWTAGLPKPTPIAEAVGISSRSAGGHVLRLNKSVMTHMRDALLNGLAKGIIEPPMQRELMHKARMKARFRDRVA